MPAQMNYGQTWINPVTGQPLFAIDDTGKGISINNVPLFDGNGNPLFPTSGSSPSSTVTGPDSYGSGSDAGSSKYYSRGDHDHGLNKPHLSSDMADVTVSALSEGQVLEWSGSLWENASLPGPASSVQPATSYGVASAVGVQTLYARADHQHGSVGHDDVGNLTAAAFGSGQYPQWNGSQFVPVTGVGGSPYPDQVVSPIGINGGGSSVYNNGFPWGPDTKEGATGPGQYGPPYSMTNGLNEALTYTSQSEFNGQAQRVILQAGIYTVTEPLLIHANNVIEGAGPYGTEIFLTVNSTTGYGTTNYNSTGSPIYAVFYPDLVWNSGTLKYNPPPVKAGHIIKNLAFGFQNSGTWTYGVQMGVPGTICPDGLIHGDVCSSAFRWENVRNAGSPTFVGDTSLAYNNFPSYWCMDGIEDGELEHCAGGSNTSPSGLPSSTSAASITWVLNGGSAKIHSGNYGWIVVPSVQFSIIQVVWDNILIGHTGKSHITVENGSNGSYSGTSQIYVAGTNALGASVSGTQKLTTIGVNWAAASGYAFVDGPGVKYLSLDSWGDEFNGTSPLFNTSGGTVYCYANMHGSYMIAGGSGTLSSLLGAGMYIQGDMIDSNGDWYNITPNESTGGNLSLIATIP